MPSLLTTVGTCVAVTDAGTAIRLRFQLDQHTPKERGMGRGWLALLSTASSVVFRGYLGSLKKEEKKPIPLHDTDAVESDVHFCSVRRCSHELGQARASHTVHQGQYWANCCEYLLGRLTDPLTCVCF